MFVGIQLEAPHGWGSFRTATRYYFAGDRIQVVDGVDVPSVLIACFFQSGKRWQSWRVQLFTLPRTEFEQALTCHPTKLRKCAHQFNLPPWLEEIDDVNFDHVEEKRQSSQARGAGQIVHSYRQQVEARMEKIAPAVEVADVILRAADPLLEVYKLVKADKSCHAHRVQLWFFAYVLHGQSQWALKRPTHRIGTWLRSSETNKDKKLGRPSISGSCFGWNTIGMRERIVNFYLRSCGETKTMISIHRNALRNEFGCVSMTDKDGKFIWQQPENKPFPSYGQFRYVVVDELGLEYVQTQIYGRDRLKSDAKVNLGNQTAQYGSILEDLQVDAYFLAERPSSMFSDEPTEQLVVAEAVCVTTGAVVGIGFSLGSETKEVYRSMLFCMAAPKNYIARLYGIPPEKLNWQMQGINPALTSDRGPAGHRSIVDQLAQQFPIKSITPSYTGQPKAAVETTHPKMVQLEGAPTYVVSDLNVILMMKREVFRAVAKNHSKDISNRLSEQAIHDFYTEKRVATPHHYWQYLSDRMRTCAREMSLEEAVRSFWTPIKLPIDRDGVRFRHRHYTSLELVKSSMMNQVGLVKDLHVQAYVLSLVVRTIWVVVNDRLIELEAAQRVRAGDEDMLVTLSQFEETALMMQNLRSATRQSAQAAIGSAEAEFEALTGVSWDAGIRKKGRPPRPQGTVAHESMVAKGMASSGRRGI